MAVHEFTLAKSGEGSDLGPLAIHYFKGLTFAITLPDAGETAEQTLANLLASCGGDHRNLRNVFVGQAARLTYQKAIKEEAKASAPRVRLHERIEAARLAWLGQTVDEKGVVAQTGEAQPTSAAGEPIDEKGAVVLDWGYKRTEDETDLEPSTREDAIARMTAIASGPVPSHSVKGEGAPSKKETETVSKARAAERKAQVDNAVANLSGLSEKRKIRGLVGLRDTNPDLFAEAIQHPDLAPLAAKLPEPEPDDED